MQYIQNHLISIPVKAYLSRAWSLMQTRGLTVQTPVWHDSIPKGVVSIISIIKSFSCKTLTYFVCTVVFFVCISLFWIQNYFKIFKLKISFILTPIIFPHESSKITIIIIYHFPMDLRVFFRYKQRKIHKLSENQVCMQVWLQQEEASVMPNLSHNHYNRQQSFRSSVWIHRCHLPKIQN